MPALESLPGKIGPYRLLEKIGEGGMGVVYLARDAQNRTAAVKVLGPLVADDPDARRRLFREVETMLRVRSPYVAEVLDADVTGPAPYIATQYVPGRTLDDVVRTDGPLHGAALDRLAAGLASALAAIHAAGVVHRDLKPGNVMMNDGNPVVIDFGIANVADSLTRITQAGMVMGTPGYLAPEVIEGQPSSGASDVHSWGSTVAFAATGQQPYGNGTFQTVFFRVLQGKAELAGVPERLLPLVSAALLVDPASRPTAQALARGCGAIYAGGAAGGLRDGTTIPDGGLSGRVPLDGTRVDGTRIGGTGLYGTGIDGTRLDGTRLDGSRVRGGPPPGSVIPPGYAGPPPGYAGWQYGRDADRELPSPSTAAANVADLLPPVEGQGGPGPADREAARRQAAAERAAQREAEAASVPRGGYGWISLALGVIAIAMSVLFPVAGTIVVLVLLTLLRAADQAQTGLTARRSVYGARASDILIVIVSAPLTVARAVLSTLVLAPVALLFALVAAAASVVILHTDTLPEAGGWAAGAAIAWYCFGPGSRRPRRQLRRITHGTIRTRGVMTVALISGWALAGAAVLSALSQPPLIWPATSWMLPALPSVGSALHSVQNWLLGRTVGMLHLP
jgi:predicted Ser/Thr protein kinase